MQFHRVQSVARSGTRSIYNNWSHRGSGDKRREGEVIKTAAGMYASAALVLVSLPSAWIGGQQLYRSATAVPGELALPGSNGSVKSWLGGGLTAVTLLLITKFGISPRLPKSRVEGGKVQSLGQLSRVAGPRWGLLAVLGVVSLATGGAVKASLERVDTVKVEK
mmetsp:Transcript_46184/g.90962  ORF Transcript_46184/g.90962 Transcript_46184/m.90962 type:complete len:164 (-) Transcript_46184:265-756(-)